MATSASQISNTLKKALFETLTAILSPIQELRTNGEQQIKALEVTDDYGIHLTELTLDANAELPIRQLASVILRQYVEYHWCEYAERFHPPETPPEAKAVIRDLLPAGLQEPVSKIRSAVAYAIAAIAHTDWPEMWPQLFNILVMNLTSENSYAVHGTMRALTEVSRDVSDNQMPQVAPIILPQMLKIFTGAEKYSIRTRGRAVEIFATCVEVISAMADYNKGALTTLLCPILPAFTEALVGALMVPDGETSDSGLKKDIINALKMLIRFVPKQMVQWLPDILLPIWTSLADGAQLFIKTVVNVTEEANNPVDSDGEVLGFENLVVSIFDFITGLVESPKCRSHVQKHIADLLYYLILYMQVTEEQIRIWNSDLDRFIEDEEDDSFSYSVRISAQDLLKLISVEFEDEAAQGLSVAVSRHLQEIQKNPSNVHWWKIHEACMVALGSVHDYMTNQLRSNNVQFDISAFLQSVILEDMNTSVSPYLLGRCLTTGSCYTVFMPDDMVQRFLEATLNGLGPMQIQCIQISAVKAVYRFCDQLKSAKRQQLLLPFLPPIMDGLHNLSLRYASDVLSLVLESISMAITIDQNFTCSVESKVTSLAIAVFLKQSSDPVLVTIAQEIFKELCRYPPCLASLERRLLPTLESIMRAPPNRVPLGLQAVSLDVLQTIVRNSPHPLSEPMITKAFPAAVYCILHTDDNSVLQNGSECLRAYVSTAIDQIAAWRDENSRGGLEYVFNVIEVILDPRTAESAAAFVGGLVSALVRKAGDSLGEKAELLLRAVLSKMQQAESLSVTQNLVMVFAQLFRTQMEQVLNFLSSVPGPTGKSALEYVLSEWVHCHHLFMGSYDNKVSAFSLSKILEHCIETNDTRLQGIEVKGDIINDNEGIKTRSKQLQNPDRWTMVPLVVKVYKILIQELYLIYENYHSADDDDSDENIDEQNNESGNGDHAAHMPVVNQDFFDDEGDDDEDDPDMLDDPLHTMNFKEYLVTYLQRLSQFPFYSSFTQHLTPQERSLLSAFVIPC